MPVYNVKKYIRESVESILNQTFNNFELILVDDGSTDGCHEICDYYVENDLRCKVFHQENKGLLLARRAGIKIATGKYLVNVDSDDKCVSTMLEELAKLIDENAPDMIIYNYSRIDDNGVITEHRPVGNKLFEKLEKQWVLNTFVSTVEFNPMWIKCTKLSLVDRNCDYSMYGRLNMAEDQLQSAALFEQSNNIFYYSKSLYLYRDNSGSITKRQTPKMVIDSLKAKKRVLEMLDTCHAQLNLYQSFYKKYYRTLNMYILKNINRYHRREDYIKFRKEIEEFELGAVSKAEAIDRILYYVLKSKCFFLIKILGIAYSIIK